MEKGSVMGGSARDVGRRGRRGGAGVRPQRGGAGRDARRAPGDARASYPTVAAGSRRPAEHDLFGVPERFMKPRLVLICVAVGLALFGLLMIYSASSVTAMASKACGYNPAYYLIRQATFLVIGGVGAVFIATRDYHDLASRGMVVILVAFIIVALAVVHLPGISGSAYGATRWIKLGPFQLQPSEFAKPVLILAGAEILAKYWWERTISKTDAAKLAFPCLVIPLALVFIQPDKGTTAIIAVTLLVMLYIAGMDGRIIGILIFLGILGLGAYSLTQDYSLSRIQTMIDPWRDELGDSYQIVQGLYAFGSGGIFGVGIGFSKQKYAYLPMAHNDFIFAVVGEECGLVGTVAVLLAFAALAWAGFKIAKCAPDLLGRLIAAGCTTILIVQLLVNVCGVLSMIPLSGKPVPFLSYGGSSIMCSVILVGLIVCVSRNSALPETAYDRRRSALRRVR